MSYPGNSSLAADIQERILQTYEQTLDLAAGGNQPEAVTGCEFILQLDPLFGPAQELMSRLQSGGPVSVDDLRLGAGGASAESAPAPAADPPELDADLGAALDVSGLEPTAASGDRETTLDWAALIPDKEEPEASGGSEEAGEVDPLASALDLSDLQLPEEPFEAPAEDSTDTTDTAALEGAFDLSGFDASSDPGQPAAPGTPNGDTEGEQRIQTLLNEGQVAFEAREYQSAIDAWSRIFLIDIDHAEANRRIEMARKLKDEIERQIEELFHDAVGKVGTGGLEEARAGFEKVLELQPTHLAAQEYLEKLDAPEEPPPPPAVEPPAPAEAATPADSSATPDLPPVPEPGAPPGEHAPDTLEMAVDALSVPGLEDEIPPAETEEPEAAKPKKKARKTKDRAKSKSKGKALRPSFLYIGGAVLLLVAVGGWLLMRNWNTTFPNTTQQTQRPQRPQVDPIARAQQLHADGNTALAVAQLRRLPPNHAQYEQAQVLIAQWEAPEEEPAAPTLSPELIATRDQLIADAQTAFSSRRFLLSQELLQQADNIAALDGEASDLGQAVALELQPLRSEIAIFRQGEWGEALRSLWRLREEDPGNPDIQRLMVDSYYNLGVRALQRMDTIAAAENFTEALDLSDGDAEIERLITFTEVYGRRQPDLLYRIFVKYLPFR